MKKIEYQTPVIKTLTMEHLMQNAASGGGSGVTGEIDTDPVFGDGGIDGDGTIDPDAKTFGHCSVWDD